MRKKAQPKVKIDTAKISDAALKLADSKGWEKVTLDGIARACKIPTALLSEIYENTANLAPVIAGEIDREAFATVGKISGSPHDILFDLLMARFDILEKNRSAILSMAEVARHDRTLSCALARATFDGVYRIIGRAQLPQPSRPILASGLVAIYSWAFWA